MKSLLKSVTSNITKDLTLIDGHPSEVKFGRNRTTAYKYPEVLDQPNFGIVKDYILVEINCFTNPIPYEEREIQSYASQFLRQRGENNLITSYGLDPFPINVLGTCLNWFGLDPLPIQKKF